MSGGLRGDPTSYKRTGIPCGNPKRYESRGVIRTTRDGTAYRDQRLETPVEDIETEGDRQLKELARKQLDTDVTLEGQLSRKRAFTSSLVYRAPDTAGSHSLQQYQDLADQERHLEELQQCGLTEEEIRLKLESDGYNFQPKVRKSNYGADPVTRKAQLDTINKKIEEKKKSLEKPDRFSGVKHMTRQEMDLERAMSHNQDKVRLLGCLMSDQKTENDLNDPNHPINHLDEMLEEVMHRGKRKGQKDTADEISGNWDQEGEEVMGLFPLTKEEYLDKLKDQKCECDEQGCDKTSPVTCDRCRQLRQDTEDFTIDRTVYPHNPFVTVQRKIPHRNDGDTKHSANQNSTQTKPDRGPVEPVPAEVIQRYRLTSEQIHNIPRFKDYSPGQPSKTLYLKNLSKKVTEADLVAIFQQFKKPEGPELVYKLMSGRMKGQAFITFDCVESATEALKLVNGYQFKDRPIIIQYGKHGSSEKDSTTESSQPHHSIEET